MPKSNFHLTTYMSQPDELEKESREFSVIKAVQSLASGRGLIGREAEITRIEIQKVKELQDFLYLIQDGLTLKRTYVTEVCGWRLIAQTKCLMNL